MNKPRTKQPEITDEVRKAFKASQIKVHEALAAQATARGDLAKAEWHLRRIKEKGRP